MKKNCERCKKLMIITKKYPQKRFCSAKCRSLVIPMPPRPDRTGSAPWNKGLKWDELSEARQGSGNPAWKGDNVGYSQLHSWVRKRKTKPKLCENCRAERHLHLSNISYEYRRDIEDWEYLCVPCHVSKDRSSGRWGYATERFGL